MGFWSHQKSSFFNQAGLVASCHNFNNGHFLTYPAIVFRRRKVYTGILYNTVSLDAFSIGGYYQTPVSLLRTRARPVSRRAIRL
jgi:hypothetical protein